MNEHGNNNEHFENHNAFSSVPDDVPLKHSGLGIASFILSLVSLVSFVVLTIVIGILISKAIDFSAIVDQNGNRTITDQEIINKVQPLIGYLVLYPLILVMEVIGLILGIVALARRGYKKVFAVIGTVLNGLALLSVFLLMVIGFLAA
ncbi:hypothetical protein [Cohnella silvisoli]|uniref:DUF4064 domain-containing protein n=1 Tax=Cohnella silvisoli TaxID=2873699 RepID=A0ABV1KVB5_9BACL|nr:hypothetical protein [Cohnella silvisoli]MCD9022840.1 hypothetical protein [Cohnella silvisoli]